VTDHTDNSSTPEYADWDPADPDAVIVQYDLSGWTFEQQAELAAELADAEVPHAWDGTNLLVPAAESVTDAVIEEVEVRLGIVDLPVAAAAAEPIPLDPDLPKTEYDLAEWDDVLRATLSSSLASGGFAFAWEDDTLVVHSEDEEQVEAVLDAVESGEITAGAPSDHDDDLPLEALTAMFLAAERLRKSSTSPEGTLHLSRALEIAQPQRPPYGVDARLWERALGLADELADAVVVEPGEAPRDIDEDDVSDIAEELHDLLRPFV
jgi:hypothetical protein